MDNCVFCKIIAGEIPSAKLYEDEKMIVIRDIEPKAPIHLLLIYKPHHKYISELNAKEQQEFGGCLNKFAKMSKDFGLENGYRIIVNQGDDAGQTVPHIHVHILGGKYLEFGNF